MKFICMKCEHYMDFQKVEAPGEGRLGISFTCSSCGAHFSMVTNPGETQLVSSLGVSLGGRTVPRDALEMTRGGLKSNGAEAASVAASATSSPAATGAGCPFSAVVQDLGLGTRPAAASQVSPADAPGPAAASPPAWSQAARDHLARLPSSVRFVLGRSVEEYAGRQGYPIITVEVVEAARRGADGIGWSPEASERLDNVPDFIRPMARREIERLARERGATTITAEVMDEAKVAFAKLGSP